MIFDLGSSILDRSPTLDSRPSTLNWPKPNLDAIWPDTDRMRIVATDESAVVFLEPKRDIEIADFMMDRQRLPVGELFCQLHTGFLRGKKQNCNPKR